MIFERDFLVKFVRGGRLFVCAGAGEEFDFAVSIGVGSVAAAANLTRILCVLNGAAGESLSGGEAGDFGGADFGGGVVREVVFVGTCGLYLDGENGAKNERDISGENDEIGTDKNDVRGEFWRPKLLDVFETTAAANVEIAGILNLAYSPLAQNLTLVSPNSNLGDFAGENGADFGGANADFGGAAAQNAVNSSSFITTDAAAARILAKRFVGENMELYGVAWAAQNFCQAPQTAQNQRLAQNAKTGLSQRGGTANVSGFSRHSIGAAGGLSGCGGATKCATDTTRGVTPNAHKISQRGAAANVSGVLQRNINAASGISWRGILCATNFCAPAAHAQYLANIAAAKSALIRYIRANFAH